MYGCMIFFHPVIFIRFTDMTMKHSRWILVNSTQCVYFLTPQTSHRFLKFGNRCVSISVGGSIYRPDPSWLHCWDEDILLKFHFLPFSFPPCLCLPASLTTPTLVTAFMMGNLTRTGAGVQVGARVACGVS